MIHVMTSNYEIKYTTMDVIKNRKINYKGWYCKVADHIYLADHIGNLTSGICQDLVLATKFSPWWNLNSLTDRKKYVCSFKRKSCFCGADIKVFKAKDEDIYNIFIEKTKELPDDVMPLLDNEEIIAQGQLSFVNKFELHLNYGKKCNFDCVYCSTMVHDNFSPFLPLARAEHLYKLFELDKKSSTNDLVITGGEPTISKEIFDLIDLSQNYHFTKITVNTNGTASFQKYQRMLDNNINLYISLHEEFTNEAHLIKLKSLYDIYKNRMNIKMLGKKDLSREFCKKVSNVFKEDFNNITFLPLYVDGFTKIVDYVEDAKEYYKMNPNSRNK